MPPDGYPAFQYLQSVRVSAITIDELDECLARYQDVLLVDVPDDMPVAMDLLERNRGIESRACQKPPVSLGVVFLALSDAIEVMDLLESNDLRHEDSGDGAAWFLVQRRSWPGRDLEQVWRDQLCHRPQFLAALSTLRRCVELGYNCGIIEDLMDLALAADSKGRLFDGNRFSNRVNQPGYRRSGHGWSGAFGSPVESFYRRQFAH